MTHRPFALQRGAASLAVVMVILIGMTLVAFFASRGLIFEQKTSANQYRSTKAFEAADAGLEWAIAMLNDRRFINNNCVPAATTVTFRSRYAIPTIGAGTVLDFSPPSVNPPWPGCTFNGGALACSCPVSGINPTLTGDAPTFTVEIGDTADPESITLVSRGCTSAGSQCVPGAASEAEGFATVRITLKVRPILRAAPAAAITTGGAAVLCNSFNLTNTDQASNGYLVNSGNAIRLGSIYDSNPGGGGAGCGGTIGTTTIPGTPFQNALVANDGTLSGVAGTADAMFNAFFGSTLASFQNAATTYVITGTDGPTNATTLATAYGQGYTSFWVEGPLQFSGTYTLGSATRPVTIASSSSLQFNGTVSLFGLLYSDSGIWNNTGAGSVSVRGAVVTRQDYSNNGVGSIDYDPDVLRAVRDNSGVLTRVPGSWRDF